MPADRRAFTLLEAVVASLIAMMLVVGVSSAWGGITRGMKDNRNRAILLGELRMAVMAIADDLPRAESTTVKPDELMLHGAGGALIRYRRDGSRLIRTETGKEKSEVVVAAQMKSFEVGVGGTYPVRIDVTAAVGTSERRLRLELGP